MHASDITEIFVESYENLEAEKALNEAHLLYGCRSPHHNPITGYGWINMVRIMKFAAIRVQRININGAIDCSVVLYDETIDTQSVIVLLTQIEQHIQMLVALKCDNARYYRSKIVIEYLQNSKAELIFLPPYAPNLNLIERYWLFFKKKVLYGRYYETFTSFKKACDAFFADIERHREALRTLLTDNFQIIGSS